MKSVDYKISIPNPNKHQFQIEINITPNSIDDITISLPNWIPGSYMIRDFAKHVLDLRAYDHNQSLKVTTISKNRFSIAHNNQRFSVKYLYHAFDLSVRKGYLDQEFGFINPAAALFCVDQQKTDICTIELLKPTHELCNNWLPASGLEGIEHDDCFEWAHYKANNYLELTDYPILFGELDIAEFQVADIPHYVVTAGKHFGDLTRVAKDLTPICQYHVNTFGELPKDVKKYLFLTMVTDNGFGGLEHLNSTALLCSRFDIAQPKKEDDDEPVTDDNYITFLSLCSHEYLHTWNVKRLKPKEFIPYQLEHEVYTKQLWFYEGMTSYFDDLSLLKTGTISEEKYLEIFAKTLTRVAKGKGQSRQSVTESSMHTWTKFYQQDSTAPDQITSYYQKGAMIACMADLLIKQESNGKHDLRSLMKQAWQLYGKNEVGTTQSELEQLFYSFINKDDHNFISHALYNTEQINLEALFTKVGIELEYHHQSNSKHIQGKPNSSDIQPWLGAVLAADNDLMLVKQVLEDSPAEHAGIAVGDKIVAINQLKVNSTNVEKLMKLNSIDSTSIHYFRKDTLYSGILNVQASPKFVASLKVIDSQLSNKWLCAEQ